MARSCLQTPSTDTRLTNIPADAKAVRMGVASPRKRLIVPPIVATAINNVALRTSVSYLIRSLSDSTSRPAIRFPVSSFALFAVSPSAFAIMPGFTRSIHLTALLSNSVRASNRLATPRWLPEVQPIAGLVPITSISPFRLFLCVRRLDSKTPGLLFPISPFSICHSKCAAGSLPAREVHTGEQATRGTRRAQKMLFTSLIVFSSFGVVPR